MLAHHRPGTLAIDVEIPGRIAERFFGGSDRYPIFGEDCTSQGVIRSVVDELADIGEGVRSGIVIDVDGEDGAKELAREERVVRVRGQVDGWVDEEAFAVIVGTADEALELFVRFGVIDDFCELVELTTMDDGTDEVAEGFCRSADFQGFGL